MEGLNPEYRNSLAKKISETPKQERKEILDSAKQTEEYQQARNEHIAENQDEESIDDGLGILLKRKTLYHGSPIGGIDTFKPAEEDTVGKGVYFTSQAKDAIGYARFRAQSSETKVPKLYESHVEGLRLLDLRNDANIAKIMPGFADVLQEKLKEYQSQQTVMSGVWMNILEDVIQKIQSGEINLSTLKTATQQTGHWFSEYVTSLGYAGIATEEGGENGIGNHDTYLVFDPEHISIRKEQDIGHADETEKELNAKEDVPTPEYWTGKPKTPFSREYVGFQIQVGRELANRSNKSLLEIEGDYLVLPHHYKWPGTDTYIDMANMSDEEIADAIYEKEREEFEKQGPTPYHDNSRYGCFSYDSHEDGIVDIHFSNEESDDTGPLTREKMEHRMHELADLFAAVKREYPNAKKVRGNSWLYNVDAYKRLFPESYTATFGEDYRDNSLPTDRVWGQFYDSKRELKQDVAEEFLKNIQALDEITPETVAAALPYRVLSTTGPIEDFYAKYGVE